jgi:phage shock protein C
MADKTLYRVKEGQMIGGVCAGIAEYFGIDPTVVRLLAVLAAVLSSGAAIIAYLVMWVAVPEKPPAGGVEERVMNEERPVAQTPGPEVTPPVAPPVASVPPPPAPAQPVAPPVPSHPPRPPAAPSRGSIWFGLALVFVGVVLLVQIFVPQVRLWQFWPIVIVIWGLVLIFRRRGGE